MESLPNLTQMHLLVCAQPECTANAALVMPGLPHLCTALKSALLLDMYMHVPHVVYALAPYFNAL